MITALGSEVAVSLRFSAMAPNGANGVNGSNGVSGGKVRAAGIQAALREAAEQGHFPRASVLEEQTSLLQRPVALLYDLDAWEGALVACRDSFGPGCLHALAIKSNPVAPLLQTAIDLGYGMECASLGEVLHAQSVGCPVDRIVFDSPCKTLADLYYCLEQGIHMNLDNFEELRRVVEIRKKLPEGCPPPSVGIRINPMVGAGVIAALSVSVADSKFGISIQREAELLGAYKENPWLNCVHVHVGSANKGTQLLVEGIKTAVDFAQRVNKQAGRRQVTVLDIGGGLGVDYMSEEACPDHVSYAADLRAAIPGLLRQRAGDEAIFDRVITEFGQSLNAKGGYIASRVEYVKATADDVAQIAVCHFGADMCPRQCYTQDHKRRVEFYDGQSCGLLSKARKVEEQDRPLPQGDDVATHVAGPLCFQGDFLIKNTSAPTLRVDDFVVMRDAGSNTLALFSRHCSRFAPTVLGYRLHRDGSVEMAPLKASESLDSLVGFWGGRVPSGLAAELRKPLMACQRAAAPLLPTSPGSLFCLSLHAAGVLLAVFGGLR
eukprot:TRINITY_DN11065_c0_g1_i1.p1 TRINITY_DN11065_c0_g1~~TRINITY_DN11065_c0_g1_i1.p1  ORF type:complete len:548 (-),score=134.06 TRINITY_DN11065_c0_g1_i1:130-1773(-)